MSVSHSTRQPSARYLTAQGLFLEVNANRAKRLQDFESKLPHGSPRTLQLSRELEADLSFYREAQREVDRLLDEVQLLRAQLLRRQLELNLERGIIADFAKARHLELELIDFTIAHLQPRPRKTLPNAA